MTQVWATRSHHLEMVKQNQGFWSIVYALRNVPREITLNVENVPGGNYSPCGTERTVEIRGQSATLFEDCSRPGHVTVQWNRGDVTLLVNTFYSEGFGRDGLLSVLETFE